MLKCGAIAPPISSTLSNRYLDLAYIPDCLRLTHITWITKTDPTEFHLGYLKCI